MKINEIIISQAKHLADIIADPKLANQVNQLYHRFANKTDNFTVLAYEIFPPEVIYETLDDLAIILKTVHAKYKHNSQAPEIINLLINYFQHT